MLNKSVNMANKALLKKEQRMEKNIQYLLKSYDYMYDRNEELINKFDAMSNTIRSI